MSAVLRIDLFPVSPGFVSLAVFTQRSLCAAVADLEDPRTSLVMAASMLARSVHVFANSCVQVVDRHSLSQAATDGGHSSMSHLRLSFIV